MINIPIEERKGTIRKINPNWPNNYSESIRKATDKYDIVLVQLKPENIDYTYTGFYKKFAPVLLDDSITDLSMRKVSVTISENCYFAMGDNRNDSSDSRYFGEINYNDICGNVRLQVEYGENIWIALFKKIKSYLSVSITSLRKIVWEKNY